MVATLNMPPFSLVAAAPESGSTSQAAQGAGVAVETAPRRRWSRVTGLRRGKLVARLGGGLAFRGFHDVGQQHRAGHGTHATGVGRWSCWVPHSLADNIHAEN